MAGTFIANMIETAQNMEDLVIASLLKSSVRQSAVKYLDSVWDRGNVRIAAKLHYLHVQTC